jgi:hypothetical protein
MRSLPIHQNDLRPLLVAQGIAKSRRQLQSAGAAPDDHNAMQAVCLPYRGLIVRRRRLRSECAAHRILKTVEKHGLALQ